MLIVHTCAINTSKKYYRHFCTSYILITSLSCTSLNTPSIFFFFGQVYKWSIAPKVRNHNVVQATIIWPILGNMVHMFGTRWKNKHIYHIIYRSILPCIGYLHNHKTKVKSSRFNFITEIGLLSHWNFNLSLYIINTIIYFNIDNIIYFSFEMTKKYLYFFHTLL